MKVEVGIENLVHPIIQDRFSPDSPIFPIDIDYIASKSWPEPVENPISEASDACFDLIQVLEIAPQVTIIEAKIEQESQRVGPASLRHNYLDDLCPTLLFPKISTRPPIGGRKKPTKRTA